MTLIAFYFKIVGLIIWLGNIFSLNIGTYSSEERKGCSFYNNCHNLITNSPLQMLQSYHPAGVLFRSIHAFASGLLTLGALISWLPGFIFLNAGGFLFAVIPPSTIVSQFSPATAERIDSSFNSRPFVYVLLISFSLLCSLPGFLSETILTDVLQLGGAGLLLIWYFACFGGYWQKTTTIAVATFFLGILFLFLSALMAGPPAYPFAFLEGTAALMQGYFLMQEMQWLRRQDTESVQ